jgi:transcriptional antiterminator NusG
MIEVLVPCTNVTRLGVGGKRVIRPEKLMPGYVLLNMRMDKDTWFSVKNSNNVQNFVGHDRARKNAAGGTRPDRNPYFGEEYDKP